MIIGTHIPSEKQSSDFIQSSSSSTSTSTSSSSSTASASSTTGDGRDEEEEEEEEEDGDEEALEESGGGPSLTYIGSTFNGCGLSHYNIGSDQPCVILNTQTEINDLSSFLWLLVKIIANEHTYFSLGDSFDHACQDNVESEEGEEDVTKSIKHLHDAVSQIAYFVCYRMKSTENEDEYNRLIVPPLVELYYVLALN